MGRPVWRAELGEHGSRGAAGVGRPVLCRAMQSLFRVSVIILEAVRSHSRILSSRLYGQICMFEDALIVLEKGLERVGGGPGARVVSQG